MRWRGERESSNVEDRRGAGGGRGLPIGRGGVGIGTIVIAFLAAWLFGINPMTVLSLLTGGGDLGVGTTQTETRTGPAPAPQDEGGRFASVVLASTEDAWQKIFQQAGVQYRAPTLVLFSGRTPSACGMGDAAAGPFYCPGDGRLYVDLSFFQVLHQRFGAAGDTAQAYVIAHEVGHHVQNLVGTMDKVQAMRGRTSQAQYNQLSVRLELQADCYAGIWAHHSQQSRQWLEPGDIEEAMKAAAAVGDDNIQRQTQGTVVPDAFTHGTSQQRMQWFRKGYETGSVQACDTFAAR
ncbi:MAG TPA: neutral zinc metallopeptidase [Quisquiliibacterium sp.]|nr:neutral zinc metallopeptidase [Quisquiliibacterium sp.]